MIFETVNEINEAIKAINYASYLIRLCALNSQISIARISYHTKKSTGFTPISVELIRISALIEEKASQLFLIMFESLRIITEEAKVSRNKALQEKFFREYKSEFGERKFELENHQAAFDELSVELSNFISKIESILKKIELLNLELIEDK